MQNKQTIDSGSYCCSQSYIKLYRDNNDDLGAFVASTAENTLGQYAAPRELTFTFSSPVSLNASSSYWFLVTQGPSQTTNGTRVYGSLSNPYADGYYSANPASDAYFRLVQ